MASVFDKDKGSQGRALRLTPTATTRSPMCDLGPKPLEEGASQGHERAIRKDGNHGDDVKHVLRNADAAGLLGQGPSSAPAELVGIESHGQQMIDQNDERRDRQRRAEAGHIGKLHDGHDILWETIMIRKHHLLPDIALGLLEKEAAVDEPLLPMLLAPPLMSSDQTP